MLRNVSRSLVSFDYPPVDMPAFQLHRVRPRRPLTCDGCTKSIGRNSVVAVCTHCKRVRHYNCSKVPCSECGSLHRRTAIYRLGKILRYW